MIPVDYKRVLLQGVSIAYTDRGEGRPILFIHSFASSSCTWMKMIGVMPQRFRFITLDIKGFGHSETRRDDHLSPVDQSQIVSEFITRMQLEDVVLVGHSIGGAIGLLTLLDQHAQPRIGGLVLVSSS